MPVWAVSGGVVPGTNDADPFGSAKFLCVAFALASVTHYQITPGMGELHFNGNVQNGFDIKNLFPGSILSKGDLEQGQSGALRSFAVLMDRGNWEATLNEMFLDIGYGEFVR